jgi:hypothetical protein
MVRSKIEAAKAKCTLHYSPQADILMAMRYLVIGFLALLMFGHQAAPTLVPVDRCCEPDEGSPPTGCTALCPICSCCLDRTPLIIAEDDPLPLSQEPEPLAAADPAAVSAPEPAEILHVPKFRLA